jgi:SAM-dependent methyltransferase
MTSVAVLEIVTPDNWCADGYLLANPDLAAAAANGLDPFSHLQEYGLQERRLQFSRTFLNDRFNRGRLKYERFKTVLSDVRGADGSFRFIHEAGAFPVHYGGSAYAFESYERESANLGLGEFNREIEANPDRDYLDIGCGLRNIIHDNCLYLEVYPSITADIIMEPACQYPIRSGSLDGISCLAVLEHVEKPWLVASEIHRMLKPGGLAFIDWPFLQPVHGYPNHYYNATRSGLEKMFSEGFEHIVLDTYPNQTPEYVLGWLLREWSAALTSDDVRRDFGKMTVDQMIAAPPGSEFWKALLDASPDKAKMTFAAGNTLIARKL